MNIRTFIGGLLFLMPCALFSHEYVVEIKSYNADIQDFVLNSYGERPVGAVASFWNDFGAVTGNRYNQIPRKTSAKLYLEGFEGCVIQKVTLNMCSNIRSGQVGVELTDGKTDFLNVHPQDFSDIFGCWLSKDHNIFADIDFAVETAENVDSTLTLTIKGGQAEGSVYLYRIVVEYDAPAAIKLESPLGYVYQKVEAKQKISDGDIIMIYRAGDAAADFDGMETSHYLDATGVTTTSDVYEPDVLHFTVTAVENHWTLTDQYGRCLGAKGKQNLAWDDGVQTWDITPGYNGATISSTNTNYGTLRYNAPDGSYPRFWNYTSTSLPLPYIYKRIRQNEPVKITSVSLPCEEREVELSNDTVCIHTTILPKTATDRRLTWSSSAPEVATVKDGIVFLHGAGVTNIIVSTLDNAIQVQLKLTVSDVSEGLGNVEKRQQKDGKYLLPDRKIYIQKEGKFTKSLTIA